MQLVSRIDGKSERLSIERRQGLYVVEIGGVRHEVDARALGPWVLSLLVAGESHETAVFRIADGVYSVNWRGHSYAVELVDPLTHLAEVSRGEAGKQGRKIVKAYMPGRVVEVRVAAGDSVEVGQPMVVLEAMKMQNEIQAERGGRVVRVFVTAGEAVEGGDPLVEVE
jgi:biotin carboxyl carrier protein